MCFWRLVRFSCSHVYITPNTCVGLSESKIFCNPIGKNTFTEQEIGGVRKHDERVLCYCLTGRVMHKLNYKRQNRYIVYMLDNGKTAAIVSTLRIQLQLFSSNLLRVFFHDKLKGDITPQSEKTADLSFIHWSLHPEAIHWP